MDAWERSDRTRDHRSPDADIGIRFGVATGRGLAIATIDHNGAFFHSGLRRGDVIISIDGRPIRSEVEFTQFVHHHPGQRVPLVILRDGREQTVYITYERDAVATVQPYDDRQASAGSRPYLGVTFEGRIRDAAVVRAVAPNSPAEQAGLRAGDEIVALNGQRVMSFQDAIAIIQSTRPGEELDIDFSRRTDDRTRARLSGRPGEVLRTATYPPDIRVERDVPPVPEPAWRDRDVDTRLDAERDPREFDRDPDEPRGGRSLLPFRRN
jgi:S1-C subfamily serine protease